jgi:hypothetical protein
MMGDLYRKYGGRGGIGYADEEPTSWDAPGMTFDDHVVRGREGDAEPQVTLDARQEAPSKDCSYCGGKLLPLIPVCWRCGRSAISR